MSIQHNDTDKDTDTLIEYLRHHISVLDPSTTNTTKVQVIHTHISIILLTENYAYKLKKAVNLGFVDYSSVQARRHYCMLEYSLNHRYSPQLYIGVVQFSGSPSAPKIALLDTEREQICDSDTNWKEFAVKMMRFERSEELLERHRYGTLSEDHMVELADLVAECHRTFTSVPSDSLFGSPETIERQMLQNFAQIKTLLENLESLEKMQNLGQNEIISKQLFALEKWSISSFKKLSPIFTERLSQGCIKSCHGDLHLGNIVTYKGKVMLFDCIEFNDSLRFIDVISDISFLLMDLEEHGEWDMARVLLGRYMEARGEYVGVGLLGFYKVYRALVRAKVGLFKLVEDLERECENCQSEKEKEKGESDSFQNECESDKCQSDNCEKEKSKGESDNCKSESDKCESKSKSDKCQSDKCGNEKEKAKAESDNCQNESETGKPISQSETEKAKEEFESETETETEKENTPNEISKQQNQKEDTTTLFSSFTKYLDLASSYTSPSQPHLVLVCGVSGSGKSYLSSKLSPKLKALHIRSDVERKRLCGLNPLQSSRAPNQPTEIGKGIYNTDITALTYSRMAEIAELCVKSGISVLVDATFLTRASREPFERLSCVYKECRYSVVWFTASESVLRERIGKRRGDASEADESVLDAQLEGLEGLEGGMGGVNVVRTDREEKLVLENVMSVIGV